MLAPGASQLIIFHLLTEGRAYARLEEGPRVPLQPGDIITFPHGDPHYLGNGEGVRPVDGSTALPVLLAQGLELVRTGGGGEPSRFICGFLACDPELSHAVLGGLPRMLRVNIREDSSGQWLENSLRFSVAEAVAARAGAEAMLARLSEVVFVETLRRYISQLPPAETGWLAGARDPLVGKALTLLHRRPGDPWTIASLAREAGASRTVLADRFRHFLGEPPIAYLTRWRLRLGAQALVSSSRGVAQIAGEVGYESEAAFNRAFKRAFGLPPARYRQETKTARSAATARVDAVASART
jgi:AraC-like DNA-binding protein